MSKLPRTKVIAIWFTDLHAHLWKSFNENNRRLYLGQQSLELIAEQCRIHKAPALFSGDLYHADTDVPQEVIEMMLTTYKTEFEDNKIPFYGISGNHDQHGMDNRHSKPCPTHLSVYSKLFPTFNLMDYGYKVTKDFMVCGIPYNIGNVDLSTFRKYFRELDTGKKPKILLIHTDLPGAKEPNGLSLETFQNVSSNYVEFAKGFDLILSGHIHKPQQLHKKVYMGGAMYQQRKSDEGCEMGYWRIYDNLELEFVPVNFPQFKQGPPDNFNYCYERPASSLDEVVHLGEETNYKASAAPLEITKNYLKDQKIDHKLKTKALYETINKL